MNSLSPGHRFVKPDLADAFRIAETLIECGVPLFLSFPYRNEKGQWRTPQKWQLRTPTLAAIYEWQPGDALCAVTGIVYDVLDFDPQNGGYLHKFLAECKRTGTDFHVQALAATPSGGYHVWINRLFIRNSGAFGVSQGVDYRGGDANGQGRGLVRIAPTVKHSKRTGELEGYRWLEVGFGGPDNGLAIYNLLSAWNQAERPHHPPYTRARSKVIEPTRERNPYSQAERKGLTNLQLLELLEHGIPDSMEHDNTLAAVAWAYVLRGVSKALAYRRWCIIVQRTEPKAGKRPFNDADFERHWSGAVQKLQKEA